MQDPAFGWLAGRSIWIEFILLKFKIKNIVIK